MSSQDVTPCWTDLIYLQEHLDKIKILIKYVPRRRDTEWCQPALCFFLTTMWLGWIQHPPWPWNKIRRLQYKQKNRERLWSTVSQVPRVALKIPRIISYSSRPLTNTHALEMDLEGEGRNFFKSLVNTDHLEQHNDWVSSTAVLGSIPLRFVMLWKLKPPASPPSFVSLGEEQSRFT